VEETRKYDLSTWPRKSDDWLAIDDASYVPSEDNINFSNGKLWKSSNQYHADFFYRLISRLIALGVDCQTMDDLISWCNDAWPLGNCKQWHNGGCGSDDGMPHAVSNLKVVSDDCTGVTLSWTHESDSEKVFK